jgi:hypothetical protein
MIKLPVFRLLALILVTVAASGMSSGGCPTNFNAQSLSNAPLEGVWTITRGQVLAKFKWSVDKGGETTDDYSSHMLEPLDPAEFPTALASLVQQWNAGLAELNTKLDAAFPAEVRITFPGYAQIRVSDVADASHTGLGIINANDEYLFVGDLTASSGTNSQGAGAELQAATIDGKFNRTALTMTGKVARTLIVVLQGSGNGSAAFTVQISVQYTGTRTGP